jgi:prevent-host-death family protein
MSKTYSVAAARAHLPEILDAVQAGKDVRLTRRNRPAAVVISAAHYDALRGARTSFATAYMDFLARHTPPDLGFDADFFASLRDTKPGRRVRL